MPDYTMTCTNCQSTGLRLDRNFVGPCEPYYTDEKRGRTAWCKESNERIRKNGTCPAHACYWCDGSPKLTARRAFCQEIGRRANAIDDAFGTGEPQSAQLYRELLDWIIENAPAVSNRSEKWQHAARWFEVNREDDARWAVTQGSVWLGYAAS